MNAKLRSLSSTFSFTDDETITNNSTVFRANIFSLFLRKRGSTLLHFWIRTAALNRATCSKKFEAHQHLQNSIHVWAHLRSTLAGYHICLSYNSENPNLYDQNMRMDQKEKH